MAPGKAVVTLAIPDTKSLMPGNYEHEHLLHPTTLDGCLHGLIAATASERKGFKHLAIVCGQTSFHAFSAYSYVLNVC